MEPYVYTFLLLIMLFALYKAGVSIQEKGTIFSVTVIIAILLYTFNEGLRFGRGIDYNLYALDYNSLSRYSIVLEWDLGFNLFTRILIVLGFPWQGCVLIISFIFIISAVLFLKSYREVLPYALPLFIFFSLKETENMVRWYLGYSFILIALSFLFKEGKKMKIMFWGMSILACSIHMGLFPIPIIFYVVYILRRPLLSPFWVFILYLLIGFLFQTTYMLEFEDQANILFSYFGNVNDRFSNYSNNTELWLTSTYSGLKKSPFPTIQEIVFLFCIVYLGYYVTKNKSRKLIYAYNLFVIGLLFNPVGKQIELAWRYDQVLMFFRGIVVAYIIKYIFLRNIYKVNLVIVVLSIIVCLNMGRKMLVTPFYDYPNHYLYVWDQHGRTYSQMVDMWRRDSMKSVYKNK